MQRTNIYLEERQTVALDALARERGITRAQLVREMIDRGLRTEDRDLERDLAAIEGAFGALADEAEPTADREKTSRDRHLDRLWAS